MKQRLVSVLLVLCMLTGMLSTTAFATGESGSGTDADPWQIGAAGSAVTAYVKQEEKSETDKTMIPVLHLAGSGKMKDWTETDKAPWYGTDVQKVVFDTGSTVTGIGAYAFFRNAGLYECVISDSVTSIGNYAFAYCYKLYNNMKPAPTEEIPNPKFIPLALGTSLTDIGMGAFTNSGISALAIHAGGNLVLGSDIFASCQSLEEVTITGMEQTGFQMINNCDKFTKLTLKNPEPGQLGKNLKSIGVNSFGRNTNLKEIVLPDTLERVESGAFSGCRGGEFKIDLPPSVNYIGADAFGGLGGNSIKLTRVNLHYDKEHQQKTIAPEAFGAGDREVKVIHLISDDSFAGGSEANVGFLNWHGGWTGTPATFGDGSITSIHPDVGLKGMPSDTVVSAVYETPMREWDLKGAPTSTVKAGLRSDGTLIFSGFGEMKNFEQGRKNEFYGQNVREVQFDIDSGVRNIGENAFYQNTTLRKITVPDTVDQIGANAFSGVTGAITLNFGNQFTAKTFGRNVFTDGMSCTVATASNTFVSWSSEKVGDTGTTVTFANANAKSSLLNSYPSGTTIIANDTSDCSLSSITSPEGAVVWDGSSYTMLVGSAVSSVRITPTARNSAATIKVAGHAVTSGQTSDLVALDASGTTNITITVTAGGQSITTVLKVTKTSEPALLNGIAMDNGYTLSPGFDSNITSYNATTTSTSKTYRSVITLTPAFVGQKITINGKPYTAPMIVGVADTGSTFTIKAYAGNGVTSKTYTINATCTDSQGALRLQDIILSEGCTLEPAFDPDKSTPGGNTYYTVRVPINAVAPTMTAVKAGSAAALKISTSIETALKPYTSGTPWTIPMGVSTPDWVKFLVEKSGQNAYTFNIVKYDPSDTAQAPKITDTKATFEMIEGEAITAHSIPFEGTVPLTWSYTGAPEGITIDNQGRVSGTPQKAGTYTMVVTLANGAGQSDSKSYTVTVEAAPVTDYTGLTQLTFYVGGGNVTSLPKFDNKRTNYTWTYSSTNENPTMQVVWQTKTYTIDGVANKRATVEVNGKGGTSVGNLTNQPFKPGTPIPINVTSADDGKTIKTYYVTLVPFSTASKDTTMTLTAKYGAQDVPLTLTGATYSATLSNEFTHLKLYPKAPEGSYIVEIPDTDWSAYALDEAEGYTLPLDKDGGSVRFICVSPGGTQKIYTVNITRAAPPLTITSPATLPAATQRQSYETLLKTTGGSGTVTWAVASGSTLPAGLAIKGNILSGIPTETGTKTFSLTATAGGVSKTQEFTLAIDPAQVALTSISVTKAPTQRAYATGAFFNPAGMVVTATFDDNSTAPITDYTYTPAGKLKTTDTVVTVSYTMGDITKTATTPITVTTPPLAMLSLAITTPPTKTTYVEGERFDKAAMVVEASYNNDTYADVTNAVVITPDRALTPSDTSVTISYTDTALGTTKTTTQPITVKSLVNAEKPVITNDLSTTLVTYNQRETNVAALDATATVNDGGTLSYTWFYNTTASTEGGTSLDVYDPTYTPDVTTKSDLYYYCLVTNLNTAATGVKSTQTYSAIAHIKVVNPLLSIAITTPPTKTEYTVGDHFDKAGMQVTGTFTVGGAWVLEAGQWDYAPKTPLTMDDTAITVTATVDGVEKTTTQGITVNKKPGNPVENTASVRYDAAGEQKYKLNKLPTDLGGNVTYTVGTVTDTAGILNGTPTCTDGTLSFTLTSGLSDGAVGKTAAIPVTVSSKNYEDFVVAVTVTLVNKTNVDSKIHFEDGELTYTGSALTYEGATIDDLTASKITYTYAVLGGDASLGDNGKPLTAGTYTVTATYEDEQNIGSKAVTLTVVKADSEVVPTPDTKTYTYGESITLTATVGMKKAQTFAAQDQVEFFCGTTLLGSAAVTSGKATLTYDTEQKDLAIGDNTIKAVYGGSVNLNGSESGTITVTLAPKALTGAVAANTTKVYDGNANYSNIGVTIADAQLGDNITATASFTTADANVGATKSISSATVTLAGAARDYYTAPTTLTGTVAITKKPITVNAVTVADKVYDGTTAAAITGITFNDLANGEALTYGADVTASAAFASANASDGVTANVTAITLATTTSANNYSMAVSTASATANITPAAFGTGDSAAISITTDAGETGKLDAGDVLTATVTAPLTGTLRYEWKNGETAVGTDSATYTLEAGKTGTITCVVTSTGNVEGTLTAEALEIGKISLAGTIDITGDTTVGSILTLDVSDMTTVGAEYTTLWSDGTAADTYTVQRADLGKNVVVTITGTDGYTGTLTATKEIPAAKPDTPVISATAGDGEVTVSWTAPFDGGSAITGYTLTGSGSPIDVPAIVASYTVTGLTNDTAYTFTLTAINEVGSTPSNAVTATPKALFTVTFSTDGGNTLDPMQVIDGETLTAPTPTKSGYNFAGWFTDAALTTAFVQTTPITENITLYAKWTVRQSSGGGTPSVPAPKPEAPVTDPDTGNTNVSLPVKPVDKGGVSTATVPEKSITQAIEAAKEEAKKTGGTSSVEIQIAAAKDAKAVDTVLSGKSLAAMAKDTDSLKISGGIAGLAFDKAALEAMANGAGKSVSICAAQVDSKKLTEAQQVQIENAAIFNFTVTSGKNTISDFGGGKVTATLPYALKDGETAGNVGAWYLDAAGQLNKLSATYNTKTQMVTFETNHFSHYVVGYDKSAAWVNPFTDVAESAWYFEAVRYANQNGLFSGISKNTFGPDATMTRSMLWTVLYRMAGEPGKTDTGDTWYADAQAWAIAQNISDGKNPDGNVTREQLATILYRYAKATAVQTDMSGFTDAAAIAAFAKDGMSWAVENKILQGNQGKLNPQGNATRAEVATMLQRFATAQE